MRWLEACFSVSNCVLCRLSSVICRSDASLAVARADWASITWFENVNDVDLLISSWLEKLSTFPLTVATSLQAEDSRFEALVIVSASFACCSSLSRLLAKRGYRQADTEQSENHSQ